MSLESPIAAGRKSQPAARQEMRDKIEWLRSKDGGWTRENLALLGVPWPPPKGWKQRLIEESET